MADSETKFKRKQKKAFRKRRRSSSDSSNSEKEDDLSLKLDDARELQKLRMKAKGVSSASLALGKKIAKTEESLISNDPFKMQTGGFIDMKNMKNKGTRLSVEEAEAIGTAFAAETNRRDEDADMLKYVEEELAKRKGISSTKEEETQRFAEDALYELPEHLKVTSHKKTEGMLSNQMLSGIPEVDLGIEAKIRNIEATEEAKQRLIQEKMNKKDKISDFVPTNMAVNFVQHNRFNIEDAAPILKIASKESPKPKPLRVGDSEIVLETKGDNKKEKDNATDDYHYDKFKKHMLRRN